jgi:hypothetical protein
MSQLQPVSKGRRAMQMVPTVHAYTPLALALAHTTAASAAVEATTPAGPSTLKGCTEPSQNSTAQLTLANKHTCQATWHASQGADAQRATARPARHSTPQHSGSRPHPLTEEAGVPCTVDTQP